MDAHEFRRRGKEMVDFVANYLERDIKNYPARYNVQQGYLKELLPKVNYHIASYSEIHTNRGNYL